MDSVRTQWRDGTAVVVLSRPPANALNLDALIALRATLETLAADAPHGLVLTGDGRAFCGGLDVKEVPAYSAAEHERMITEINAMITVLYGFPTATVAAVNGHAIGAGLVLVLACDARLAVPDDVTKLGLTEVTAGISYPAGPMEVVNAEIEPSVRRHLVLSGAIMSPGEARSVRIVDDVLPIDRLVDSAVALARSRASAPAYADVKAQLRGVTLARMRQIDALARDGGERSLPDEAVRVSERAAVPADDDAV